MRKLIIFLIVLIVLLAVVDRVAVAGVQRDLSNRISAAADLSGTPTVTIEGIPFLTQAIAGRYPTVSFNLGTLNLSGVPLKNLHGTATNVTAPLADVVQNTADIRAEKLVINGTISNATIDKFAPKGIKITGNGSGLVASGELPVGVQKVKFTAEMRIELSESGLKLVATKIQGVPDAVAKLITYTIPFKGKMPFNAKITSVKPVAEGLEFTAEGSDVPLNGRR